MQRGFNQMVVMVLALTIAGQVMAAQGAPAEQAHAGLAVLRNRPNAKRYIKAALSPVKVCLVATACVLAHDVYSVQPNHILNLHQNDFEACDKAVRAGCMLFSECIPHKDEKFPADCDLGAMLFEDSKPVFEQKVKKCTSSLSPVVRTCIASCEMIFKRRPGDQLTKRHDAPACNFSMPQPSWSTAIKNFVQHNSIVACASFYFVMQNLYDRL